MKGSPEEFTVRMEEHEPWMRVGWLFVAGVHAAKGDYRRAYEQAEHYLAPPQLPSPPPNVPVPELRRTLYLHPGDFAAGYAFYLASMRDGTPDQALTTLQKLTQRSDCPAYFNYLEAGLFAQKEQWQQAWKSILRAKVNRP